MSKKEKIASLADLFKNLILSFLAAAFALLGYTFVNVGNFLKITFLWL